MANNNIRKINFQVKKQEFTSVYNFSHSTLSTVWGIKIGSFNIPTVNDVLKILITGENSTIEKSKSYMLNIKRNSNPVGTSFYGEFFETIVNDQKIISKAYYKHIEGTLFDIYLEYTTKTNTQGRFIFEISRSNTIILDFKPSAIIETPIGLNEILINKKAQTGIDPDSIVHGDDSTASTYIADPNTINRSGFFLSSRNHLNSIAPSGDNGKITVVSTVSSDLIKSQIALDSATGRIYTRSYNGTWYNWLQTSTGLSNEQIVNGNLNRATQLSNRQITELRNSGFYSTDATCLGLPDGITKVGTLIISSTDANSSLFIYSPKDTGILYTATLNNSVFSNWKAQVDNGDSEYLKLKNDLNIKTYTSLEQIGLTDIGFTGKTKLEALVMIRSALLSKTTSSVCIELSDGLNQNIRNSIGLSGNYNICEFKIGGTSKHLYVYVTSSTNSKYLICNAGTIIKDWTSTSDTKEDALTYLKANDGHGSGVDSDTVDGKHSSDFLNIINDGSKIGIRTSARTSGQYYELWDSVGWAELKAGAITANGTIHTTGDLTVGGNLIVNGTTITLNTDTMTLKDPILTLGGSTPLTADDNKDRGIEFRWHNGTTAKLGFFGFDDSTGKFTFIPDATNTSEVFSGTAGTIVANLEGNVVGNASTATTLQHVRSIAISGDGVGTATNFNGSANIIIPFTLNDTGVAAGIYKSITVDAKGRVTAGTNPTTLSGYGITDATPSSHIGTTGSSHGVATTSVAGFMSSADKSKLNGVAENANNYSHPADDGNLHVPATGTTNNTKVLKAGATAGSISWSVVNWSEVANKPTQMPASDVSAWAKQSSKPSYTFSEIDSKPTTLGGYGITDAVSSSDSRLSDSRPASDVSAWAKATTKPSYSHTEVGAAAASHTHTTAQVTDLDAALASRALLAGSSSQAFSTANLSVTGTITATGNITGTSDKTLKENFARITGVLDKIKKISGYTYNFINDKSKKTYIGMMAQDWEKDFAELVETDSNGKKSLAYMNTTAVILEAIKELDEKVESLKKLL